MNQLKKTLALTLCAATVCTSLAGISPARAASGDASTIQQVIGSLGVITGDKNGNLNLSSNVTRAQFAKMLVCASVYKDTVSSAGNASPFVDVPYTNWAASYIKTAVAQGWMSGYLDGTFRPNHYVTCAEAATAVLKLLGYTSDDFAGTFPYAQMSLYESLDLNDGISDAATNVMSRQDCMRLFYNLLSVKTKSTDTSEGVVYAKKLGYALESDDTPDYDDILNTTMDGPVVLTGTLYAAVGFTPSTIYRNDSQVSASALQSYDVLYYSKDRKTVWAYARRVTGTLQAVSPNRESPTSVTVAGTSYDISGSLATSMLGTSGGLSIGSNVTVLLGKDGKVVAAYAADTLNKALIGVITAIDKTKTYTAADGTTYTQPSTTVLGTDGQSYTVPAYDANLTVGTCVQVHYGSDATTLNRLPSAGNLTGTVSAANNTIGSTQVASDAEILDVNDTGGVKTYLSRINGLTFSGSAVKYYEKDAAGVVQKLILNDVTGDMYTYGLLRAAVKSTDTSGSTSVTYQFQVGSSTSEYTQLGTGLGSLGYSGPVQIDYESDGTVKSIHQLTTIANITSVTTTAIKNAAGSHAISDNVLVYRYSNQNNSVNYYVMDRNAIDSSKYSIQAYYDKADSQGGRVRVVIMTEK